MHKPACAGPRLTNRLPQSGDEAEECLLALCASIVRELLTHLHTANGGHSTEPTLGQRRAATFDSLGA